MDLVGEAYLRLFNKPFTDYSYSLQYSKRLWHYNAHVRISGTRLTFNLSANWKSISEDIQIGLIQSLLTKVLKQPRKSLYIDLYHHFVKKLSLVVPTTKEDPMLRESFERVNERYFHSLMEMPNLCFGKKATRTLGSYNFHTNTITISPVLLQADQRLVDYVMYHELLHMKLQFATKRLRTQYHSKTFKQKERQFDDAEELEEEIRRFLSKVRS